MKRARTIAPPLPADVSAMLLHLDPGTSTRRLFTWLAFIRGAMPGFARQVPSARPHEGKIRGARLPDSKHELCLLGFIRRRFHLLTGHEHALSAVRPKLNDTSAFPDLVAVWDSDASMFVKWP